MKTRVLTEEENGMATKAQMQEEIDRLRDEGLKHQLDNIELGMNGHGREPSRTYGVLRTRNVTFGDRASVVRNRLEHSWALSRAERLDVEAALSSMEYHALQAGEALRTAERITEKGRA